VTDLASATPAVLTITRPRGFYRDSLRAYCIDLDGGQVATIRPGGQVELPITAGTHLVRARIDWTGSLNLRIETGPGQRIALCVKPAGGPFAVLWQAFGSTRYLRLTCQD
jgi:hypothetical protein